MTIKIPLTKGLVALVDDADADLATHHWYANNGYAVRLSDERRVKLHRLILERILGSPIPHGMEPDHINRDRCDNRRCNLRVVNHTANMVNRQRARVASGFKGVYRRSRGRWRAVITINGQQHNLGSFSSPVDAALAYNHAATKTWGEYVCLNDV